MTEVIYDKTVFPSRPQSAGVEAERDIRYERSLDKPPDLAAAREAGKIFYDRSKDLLPKDGEYEPVPPAKIQTDKGMIYDASYPDPLDPSVFKVGLSKQASEQIYTSTPANPDEMTFSGVGNFLKSEFSKGLDNGGDEYSKSLSHYEKVITEGDLFRNSDIGLQSQIRNLFAEVKGIKTKEELAEFWGRVEEFCGNLEIKKKGGK